MDAYGSGTSRRGEDAVTAAGVAAAGAVGGDHFAVGRVRARDLRAEGTFILIIVRAIELTSCFVVNRRRDVSSVRCGKRAPQRHCICQTWRTYRRSVGHRAVDERMIRSLACYKSVGGESAVSSSSSSSTLLGCGRSLVQPLAKLFHVGDFLLETLSRIEQSRRFTLQSTLGTRP